MKRKDSFWSDVDAAEMTTRSGYRTLARDIPTDTVRVPPLLWLGLSGEEPTWGWVGPVDRLELQWKPATSSAKLARVDRLHWSYGQNRYPQLPLTRESVQHWLDQKQQETLDPSGRLVPQPVLKRALDAFIKLTEGLDGDLPKRVRAFAQRYGVLGLCTQHELPAGHNSGCALRLGNEAWPAGYERIDDWRFYSQQARLIVRVAAQLHMDLLVPDDLMSQLAWADLKEDSTPVWPNSGSPEQLHDPKFAAMWWSSTMERQRQTVCEVTNVWLALGGVRPSLYWFDSPPRTIFSGGSWLFGVLAIQLAYAVAKQPSREFDTCTACGQPITGRRLTREGYRAFCDKPECRRARARLAKRDQRAGLQRWQWRQSLIQ